MMRDAWILGGVLLLSFAVVCHGLESQESTAAKIVPDASIGGAVPPEDANHPEVRPREVPGLGIELSTIVTSKHMWHGFDLLDDRGAFIPVASFTFGDTGLAAKIIGVYPLAGGLECRQELNGNASYTRALFENTRYLTAITLNYFYYGKPRLPSRMLNVEELGIAVSWPALCPLGGSAIVPSYYVADLWPARSHAQNSDCGGFMHVLGLTYDFAVPDWHWGSLVPRFGLHSDITYNDGFGGPRVDHDWSHATFGATAGVQHGHLALTLSLNHQISMDRSVDDEDETWCGLDVTYHF